MHKIIYEDCIQIIKDNDIEKLRNKSFLITGASGMIGSYVSYVLKVLNDEYNMNMHLKLPEFNDIFVLFQKQKDYLE